MSGEIIQLAGTLLAAIEMTAEGALTLNFSPFIVIRSEGIPGVDAGSQWQQNGILHLQNASLQEKPTAFPVEVCAGKAKMNQYSHIDMLPVPCESPGVIELELVLKGYEKPMTLSAEYIRLELLGLAKYIRHI